MGFNYLFIFPPSYVALCGSKAHHRLGSESVSWCLETSLFFKTPSWDRSPLLPLLPLFLSFIFFPTSFWRQWAAFLGAWCPLPAFRSCFVEFTQHSNVLLMNLWGRKYSSAYLGPPLWTLFSLLGDVSFGIGLKQRHCFFYRNVNNDFNFMSYGEHNFLHHLTDCHFSLMERFILEK